MYANARRCRRHAILFRRDFSRKNYGESSQTIFNSSCPRNLRHFGNPKNENLLRSPAPFTKIWHIFKAKLRAAIEKSVRVLRFDNGYTKTRDGGTGKAPRHMPNLKSEV